MPPFTSCVTLGKLLNFSELRFHSLCILCVSHCWRSEPLSSPPSISDPSPTHLHLITPSLRLLESFASNAVFPSSWLLGFIRISCLAESGGTATADQGIGNLGGTAKTGTLFNRYNANAALWCWSCCCELGIDLRKAGEPWLQSSHVTGSREES